MIELKKISITDNNMKECIELEVSPEQTRFVAHNAVSLGQAYAANKRGGCAVPYAIYEEDLMVGFVMYGYLRQEIDDTFGEDCYYFWRLMIDKDHQRKGYGKQAVKRILDEVKRKPIGAADHIYISYEPENTVAQTLYKSFGFEETGQIDDGELVARLRI
jgi:diamine N-acetyltransferase